ncbi:MAG: hypothetical protein IT495_17175 [Gammaproteobacteria bacterium]|nr:hypothetical protein [Gammaproteobacteria bacterium]
MGDYVLAVHFDALLAALGEAQELIAQGRTQRALDRLTQAAGYAAANHAR